MSKKKNEKNGKNVAFDYIKYFKEIIKLYIPDCHIDNEEQLLQGINTYAYKIPDKNVAFKYRYLKGNNGRLELTITNYLSRNQWEISISGLPSKIEMTIKKGDDSTVYDTTKALSAPAFYPFLRDFVKDLELDFRKDVIRFIMERMLCQQCSKEFMDKINTLYACDSNRERIAAIYKIIYGNKAEFDQSAVTIKNGLISIGASEQSKLLISINYPSSVRYLYNGNEIRIGYTGNGISIGTIAINRVQYHDQEYLLLSDTSATDKQDAYKIEVKLHKIFSENSDRYILGNILKLIGTSEDKIESIRQEVAHLHASYELLGDIRVIVGLNADTDGINERTEIKRENENTTIISLDYTTENLPASIEVVSDINQNISRLSISSLLPENKFSLAVSPTSMTIKGDVTVEYNKEYGKLSIEAGLDTKERDELTSALSELGLDISNTFTNPLIFNDQTARDIVTRSFLSTLLKSVLEKIVGDVSLDGIAFLLNNIMPELEDAFNPLYSSNYVARPIYQTEDNK